MAFGRFIMAKSVHISQLNRPMSHKLASNNIAEVESKHLLVLESGDP